MNLAQKDFCFCSLALGKAYRDMAMCLASDIRNFFPNTKLIVFTDNVNVFKDISNVKAHRHHQVGVWHCANDKRLVLKKSLEDHDIAIQIDVDTHLVKGIPDNVSFLPGISARYENLEEHILRSRPEQMGLIKHIASKMGIELRDAKWIGEALFAIRRDNGKERDFINIWEKIATYLELHGFHGGEGNIMGLAAEKAGLSVTSDVHDAIGPIVEHLDFGRNRIFSKKESFSRRLGYHYRLNKLRLKALRNFNFYYH